MALVQQPDMDELVACEFCGKEQPRAHRNCALCNKALPLPPIKFKDDLPGPCLARATGWTVGLLVLPAIAWASVVGLDPQAWAIFVGVWLFGTLIDWLIDFRSGENEAAALDTPDFSGGFHSPGAGLFFALRFSTFPMHAVRTSWGRFWRSL